MSDRLLGRGLQFSIESLDGSSKFASRVGAIQHIVCPIDLCRERHLISDTSECFGSGEVIASLETCDLGLAVGGDYDDLVHAPVHAGFEEERYFIDHHGARLYFCDGLREPRLFTGDARVDDPFEPAQFGTIPEHDVSQGRAIQGAIRFEDVFPELVDDFSPSWCARFDDLPGELIGIDDFSSTSAKHVRHGALAGRDTASKPYQNHAAEHSMHRQLMVNRHSSIVFIRQMSTDE